MTNKAKDISKMITLVYHTIRFPDPSLPNKSEYFDIEDPGKNIMTFGKIKLFNDIILNKIYEDKSRSPIYRMKLIRSRLQAFIEEYTFPFMNGLSHALPDTTLVKFVEITKKLTEVFNTEKERYMNDWAELREESIQYYIRHKELYPGITADEMQDAIVHKLLSFSKELDDKFLFQITYFDIKPTEMTLEESDIEEKRLQIEAKNTVAKHSEQNLEKTLDEFRDEVKEDLRTQTIKTFSDLLQAIESDKWNQKSINSVVANIEKFKKLNFLNDKALESFLDKQLEQISKLSAKDIKKENKVEDFRSMISEALTELNEKGSESTKKKSVDPF